MFNAGARISVFIDHVDPGPDPSGFTIIMHFIVIDDTGAVNSDDYTGNVPDPP